MVSDGKCIYHCNQFLQWKKMKCSLTFIRSNGNGRIDHSSLILLEKCNDVISDIMALLNAMNNEKIMDCALKFYISNHYRIIVLSILI